MSENRYRKQHPEDEINEERDVTQEDQDDEIASSGGLLSSEEATYRKRYGDLRRHTSKREEELKARIKELEQNSNKSTTMPSTKEEVEEWAASYPDLYKVLKTIMREEITTNSEISPVVAKRIEELETQVKTSNNEITMARAMAELQKLHPDFLQLREDPKFREWANKQPEDIQALLKGMDPFSAARAIDLYKADAGIAKKAPKAQDNRSAASSVATSAAISPDGQERVWSESMVAKLSDRDFEKYEAEIEKASRSGKLVLDITGGAR